MDGNASADSPTSRYVRRAIDGDVEAFGKLVERFDPLVRAVAEHHMGNALRRIADPEDLVMETWGVLWRRLPELRFDGPSATRGLLAFLTQTLRFRVANLLRRSIRLARAGESDPADRSAPTPIDALPADVTNVTARVRRHEAHALVRAAIDSLDESDRAIIILRGLEGVENAEAARLLDLEPNTCAVRYRRALAKLRSALPDSVFHELE